MKIEFLGGADEVGASCTLIEIEGQRILVDAGSRPDQDKKQFPDLDKLDKVGRPDAFLLTHAHTDHTGALPRLVDYLPDVKGYCTPATKPIMRVLLENNKKRLQPKKQKSKESLFISKEIDAALQYLERMVEVLWWEPIPICEGVTARWMPAGHILGAAMILVEGKQENILMTGDVSVTNQKTIPGISMSRLPYQPDLMVMESTYGDRQHEDRTEEERRLISDVAKVIKAGGKVLTPVFAIGRSQEVILILKGAMEYGWIPKFPVYIDGMVRDINGVYSDYSGELTPPLQREAERCEDLFYSNAIREITSQDERDSILAGPPCCIVASSGMLISGSSSYYYAKHLAPHSKNMIAITGYQAIRTPGRRLLDQRVLELDNETPRTVECQVESYSLSAHADRNELTRVVEKVQPRTLFLVHGDADARRELSKSVREACPNVDLHLPENGRIYLARGIRKYQDDRTEERSDPAEAIGYLRPSVEEYKKNGDTGAFIAAIQSLTDAQAGNNELISYVYLLSSEVLSLRWEYDCAIEYITKALELNPDNAEAYALRGQVHLQKGDYDRAITDCTKAIDLNPNDTNAYWDRGQAYEGKGDNGRAHADFDRVIVDCTKATALNPNDTSAYWCRGYAYRSKGDYDQAITDFTKVIDLDPNHIQAYFQRGQAYRDKGDNGRAHADIGKSIKLSLQLC